MVHLLLIIIYLAFISLGLPDSILGSAWPSMYGEFRVPVSYAGIISMIISAGTVVSSLQSDRLTKRLGTGRVTALSVAMTAAALLGFSFSHSFWLLCLWAIPYGLGAGSVDAALNNYVALHYASCHMSWLHCMWGAGAIIGPNVMGYALTGGQGWNMGYRYISFIQLGLSAVLFLTLPLWRTSRQKPVPGPDISLPDSAALTGGAVIASADDAAQQAKALSLRQIFAIPGVKEVLITFFCYCALESTAMLWSSSYMVLYKGIAAETAAGYAGMFFIGITAGRVINGFLTFRFSDAQIIRAGQGIIAAGILVMLLPGGSPVTLAGLTLTGLGCAPIYPCVIHSTPAHFGADQSQAIIGVQMASAYVGTCLMPPLFGLIASHLSVSLLPFFLLACLVLMFVMHEALLKRV